MSVHNFQTNRRFSSDWKKISQCTYTSESVLSPKSMISRNNIQGKKYGPLGQFSHRIYKSWSVYVCVTWMSAVCILLHFVAELKHKFGIYV